jgi:L-2,4-diaminobutyric acid acetyltransferase
MTSSGLHSSFGSATAGNNPAGALVLRRPTLSDAVRIFDLIQNSENLDKNSLYLYMLLCRDFSSTCRVAELGNNIAGVVTAYLPSHQPKLVFVWQVAVAKEYRGRGIALAMLTDMVAGLAAADPWLLQTTITPSNLASQKLFESLAARFHAPISVTDGFHESLFEPYRHEPERLYTIGPISSVCQEPASGNRR